MVSRKRLVESRLLPQTSKERRLEILHIVNKPIFIEDFRQLEALIIKTKQHNLTLRQLELLLTLRTPRMAEEVEQRIGMDRMTLKKMWKKSLPGLITKVTVPKISKSRGKDPVLFGLTEKGVDTLLEINALLNNPTIDSSGE